MFFDPLYFIMILPGVILGFWAQRRVKGAFDKWSRYAASSGLTGAQAAKRMLEHAGVAGVEVEQVQGFLSDHYDPRHKKLRLSPNVYASSSVAAVGIACHEAGHALQHAKGYAPLALRSALVPAAQFGSMSFMWLLLAGMLLQMQSLVLLAIVVFAAAVLFQLVTLPVEFDASNRAKAQVRSLGIASSPQESEGVSAVLNAAALTYVAGAITAVMTLLYYIMAFTGRRD